MKQLGDFLDRLHPLILVLVAGLVFLIISCFIKQDVTQEEEA